MSQLHTLRSKIKEILVGSGLWTDDEVIIKRRTDIWNDVNIAVATSGHGHCLVIGVAKGDATGGAAAERSKSVSMDVIIPITLFEEPNPDPDDNNEEDERWEKTLLLLEADPLGRSELHYHLNFVGFDDVEHSRYVTRQTLFKTGLLITPGNTPLPEPPAP